MCASKTVLPVLGAASAGHEQALWRLAAAFFEAQDLGLWKAYTWTEVGQIVSEIGAGTEVRVSLPAWRSHGKPPPVHPWEAAA